MAYITSDRSFPMWMIDLALTKKAVLRRRSAMFLYEDGDETFKVSARDCEYQELVADLTLALESFGRQPSALASEE
jgi:hypothetical protein